MKPSTLLSRKSSAAVFGLGAATGAGASGFFAAALFLEKLLSDFLPDFFGEFFDEFFGGFAAARVALFDGRFGSFFDEALPFEAPVFFFDDAARLPVDADFARGDLSFRYVQVDAVNGLDNSYFAVFLPASGGVLRAARSAVDDRPDFSPCRKVQAGAWRPGSEAAAFSEIRKRAKAWPAVEAEA